MNNIDLYKKSGIVFDKDWLEDLHLSSGNSLEEFIEGTSAGPAIGESEASTEKSNGYESDNFSQIDEQEKKIVGNTDTLLDDPETFSDKTYTFAPGEGQQPLSLYQDPDAEYLAFPTIFYGHGRVSNEDRKVDIQM